MSLLRAIPPDLDSGVVAAIDARLARIENEHDVTILWAIESGSRAWGFPSPDSDYDARFIFVRPVPDYLSVSRKRDVIETPLEGVFDVNGWDLFKLAKLILSGNAVALEWLKSPIVYHGTSEFRDEWLTLSSGLVDRTKVIRHYFHLGSKQFARHIDGRRDVPLKKIFYSLRPALALQWLRLHPNHAVAPMNLQELLPVCEIDPPALAEIADLLARKATTREMGERPMPPLIEVLIRQEFNVARTAMEAAGPPIQGSPATIAEMDRHLQRWLRGHRLVGVQE